MEKNEFDKALRDKPIVDIVQEYLFEGVPYCFKDTPEIFVLFRQMICDEFGIHRQNFTVVGSAKIGFSLSPENYGRVFNKGSDIDVVLVSEELFQDLWWKLIEYKKTTVYHLNKSNRDRFQELQSIIFYGSIRLDKLTDDFTYARNWWMFFNSLSIDKRFGPRRVRAMLFKSWRHVSSYYEDGIRKVKDKYESNRI
jgi:hypothetical protein